MTWFTSILGFPGTDAGRPPTPNNTSRARASRVADRLARLSRERVDSWLACGIEISSLKALRTALTAQSYLPRLLLLTVGGNAHNRTNADCRIF